MTQDMRQVKQKYTPGADLFEVRRQLFRCQNELKSANMQLVLTNKRPEDDLYKEIEKLESVAQNLKDQLGRANYEIAQL